MSKAKKRYKRRKYRNSAVQSSSRDNHHLFYQRRHYSGVLAELRTYAYCVVPIPKNTLHRQIHEFVGDIPAPRPASASGALNELRTLYRYGAISDNDGIEKRLRVLIALFECIEQPTADGLRQQLSIVLKYKGSV